MAIADDAPRQPLLVEGVLPKRTTSRRRKATGSGVPAQSVEEHPGQPDVAREEDDQWWQQIVKTFDDFNENHQRHHKRECTTLDTYIGDA